MKNLVLLLSLSLFSCDYIEAENNRIEAEEALREAKKQMRISEELRMKADKAKKEALIQRNRALKAKLEAELAREEVERSKDGVRLQNEAIDSYFEEKLENPPIYVNSIEEAMEVQDSL